MHGMLAEDMAAVVAEINHKAVIFGLASQRRSEYVLVMPIQSCIYFPAKEAFTSLILHF